MVIVAFTAFCVIVAAVMIYSMSFRRQIERRLRAERMSAPPAPAPAWTSTSTSVRGTNTLEEAKRAKAAVQAARKRVRVDQGQWQDQWQQTEDALDKFIAEGEAEAAKAAAESVKADDPCPECGKLFALNDDYICPDCRANR